MQHTSVSEWLATLGLAQYAPAFVEQQITFPVLATLTEQDLKDLGVSLLGHRRTLLLAIAERARVVVEASVGNPGSAVAPDLSTAPKAAAAERRQLTVMFCDLVGSTALAARLDPEDVRDVVRGYQGACAKVIARYEGFVAQYLGDGIMAYFGYPTAHEDDAERAVRSGLDLVAAIGKLDLRAKVEVRVGIATGLVVVGDLIGEQGAKERAVTGETPNLAARLQSLAAPGSIVVSAATRRLLGGQFELRDLGSQSAKGLDAPVQAFAIAGVRSFESRFEARAGGLTGFVGREEECEHLLDRWKLARQEKGQAVLVSGEAGIGKSRLTAWLVDMVSAEPHTRMRYQCTPHHKDSALYPTITQIERAAGIEANEAAETKLEKLERLLVLVETEAAETVPLFAGLLAIPVGEKYAPLEMSPGQQRQRTLAALLDQVEALARQQPLLMVYEDAHWADATSLELLDALVDRLARLPVLFVVTGRPEFSPAWAGRHNVSTVTLQKLDKRHTRAMVESVTGGAALPVDVLDQIVQKTDGVPLFVEELTKTVMESGALVEDGGSLKATGSLPIPATLQDSLMARLDRSNPVKEIAQIGALIGREFSYQLLLAVAGMDEGTVRTGLAKLEEAELATRRGIPPEATYTFKHALVQDAAYESLLKSRRRTIHRRVAKTLRDNFSELAQSEPEIVAYHFERAERTWQASGWWTKAGLLANRRGAYVEAANHFGRAVNLADKIILDSAQLRPRLQLQIEYRSALISVRGWGAQETIDAFAQSTDLGARLGGLEERMAGNFAAWLAPYMRGDATIAFQLSQHYRETVQELNLEFEMFTADNILAQSSWPCGRFVDAVRFFESSMKIYERQKHLPWFGADGVTINLSQCAVALWPLGRVDESLEKVRHALAHAQTTGSFSSVVFAVGWASYLAMIRGKLDDVALHAREVLHLAARHDLKFWLLTGDLCLQLSGCGHENLQAISKCKEYIAILKNIGCGFLDPVHNALLSELVAQNDLSAALQIIDETLSKNSKSGLTYFDSELCRKRGKFNMMLDYKDKAIQSLLAAIKLSKDHGARCFELQACLDLARVYCHIGRKREAVPLLQGALVGFTETRELPQIAEAQQLLASLGTELTSSERR